MSFQTFPQSPSIPPPEFYNFQGLAGYLNTHPSFKNYFIHYPNLFPYLRPIKSTLSSLQYNTANVPIASLVTTLSQQQTQQYLYQLSTFRNVYAFNSTAYGCASLYNTGPVYYSFKTYKEMSDYKAGVALVNKLYSFDAMANGTNDAGATLGWVVPFPL